MAERKWTIDGDPLAVDMEEELEAALAEAAIILNRIGGAVVIIAERERVADEMYATTGLLVKWTSYGGPASEPEAKAQNGQAEVAAAA